MKSNLSCFIMITLVLIAMLSIPINTKAVLTQTSEIEDLDEILRETNENDLSRNNDRNNQQDNLDYKTNDGKSEELSFPNSPNLVDWAETNKTTEWNKFAFSDGNFTKIIVGINNECGSYAELEKLVNKHDGHIVNTVSIKAQIIATVVEISIYSASAFIQDAHATEFTSYIEPDMKVQAQLVPNDPYWSMQWGPQRIEADWAWNTTLGDPSVLVAVVDTGIDYTHPDLAANYVTLGYDWVNNDADPMDDHWHGTHCAGIIAAVLNNSIGIAGLAQVRIMAEKVLDWSGSGYWDWIANGIINATDCGADIISMSIGGYYDSELVHQAVRYAYDAGVLLIAAAGNDNTNMKLYPAGYDEVVAVAATDQYDNKAYFSNWGEWIELAAPGVDIYSTVLWGYDYAGGTSMACPHVAGVAALVWSRYPSKTRDWLRLWLRHTADDLGDEGFDIYFGYGRVNARKSVVQAPPAHELIAYEWRTSPYVEPLATEIINATILNFGENNETDVTVQLLANYTVVDSISISFLASGNSATVSLLWNPTVEGLYNVTLYVVPVPGETSLENNVAWKYIYVGSPVKAAVLHSAGNIIGEIITSWQVLNGEWHRFGDTMVYIDYTTLNKEDITYEDITATGADVLIISCAADPYSGWEFTDPEIEAIKRYVYEGHGLIATAGTFYYGVPNNNKLAPLFGLNETIMWDATETDLMHLLNATHPLFRDVPNPFVFAGVGTAIPYDWQWDSNELVGGTYLAKGHLEESAIVTYRGLLYISPWLEVIQPYYHHHLQLLYNAITWSTYQKPEHELVVSLECPLYLEPSESTMLNATVANIGLQNETDVELFLLINGGLANSTTISELLAGTSYTLSHLWTPTVEAAYNVTAYTPIKPEEEFIFNNVESMIVYVRVTRFVLWDDVHDTDGDSLTGNYLELYQLLSESGFVVNELTSGTINTGLLAYYDILVVIDPEIDFSSSEIIDIQNWVTSGGSMVVIIDTGFPSTLNMLIEPYGVSMTGSRSGYGTTMDIASHPITQNVGSIYYDLVWEIAVTLPSEPLAWTVESYAFLSATTDGEVVIISDSNIMDNLRLAIADNTQLMLNIFNWIGVKYEHDLTVTLDAPTFLMPGDSTLLSATVTNRGLSNETDVELFLLINGTAVNSTTISELLTGQSYTINYLWTSTVEATYNVTAYAPPVPGESVTENNIVTKMVRVRLITVALISDLSELVAITPILDSMSINYDIYNDNNIYLYTEDFHLLLRYQTVIFNNYNREITSSEHSALQSYLSSGGNLLVTGYDSLGSPSDMLLADIVRSSSVGDNVGEPDLYVMDETHPIMNGPYGSFPALYYISGLYSDCDAAEADTGRNAITVAQLADAFDKIIATELSPGRVVYWNGKGSDDWTWNVDCETMLKNAIAWFIIRYEHELSVSLEAPDLLKPSDSTLLNATVQNRGLSNETNVELLLMINGTTVDNATLPKLVTGSSYTLRYLWTPTVEGVYNVTAYTPPVLDENVTANNAVSKMICVRSLPRLLVVDTPSPEDTGALDMLGYEYTLVTPAEFATVDLYQYNVLFVGWDPGDTLVDALLVRASDIADWVAAGNGIVALAEFYEVNRWTWLPLGVSGSTGFHADTVHIIDPAHPVMADLTDAELSYWGNSYHGYFISYDSAWEALAEGVEAAQPITLATTYGAGRIAITDQDPDYHFYYGYEVGAGKLLKNMIEWVTPYIRYEHEIAISLEAPTFLEPGDSTRLNATVSNRGLSNETNVELLLMINGTIVNNITIPEFVSDTSYSLDYLWTPTVKGKYNVTAYAPPVLGEEITSNNIISSYVHVTFAPRILAYVEYTDYDQEYEHALRAIDSTFGPTYILTDLWDYTQLDVMLPENDILLIPEQEYSNLPTMESIGATWAATLSNFMIRGGIIIVCDHSGGSHGILTGAGLMSISSVEYVTGWDIRLVAPADPLAKGVSESFVAPNGALSFITNETTVVFRTTMCPVCPALDPVVIHKRIGPGHIALIGFDYYESNTDTDRILGNAVGLVIRPTHDLIVSARAWPSFPLGTSTLLRATVYNFGLSNETDVELYLLINGSTVASKTIPECPSGSVYALSYLWTPTVEGTYNLTAYAPPVPDEELTENNLVELTVSVFTVTGTYIHVSPPVSTMTLGETFTIDVDVVNVTDLYVWQVKLYFDPMVLRCTAAWYPPDHVFADKPFLPLEPVIDNVNGYVLYACTLLGTPPTFSGSGTLCKINFTGIEVGSSNLLFSRPYGVDTVLMTPEFETIPCMVIDGVAELLPPEMPPFHDVAIISLTTSATEVYARQMVHITAVAVNKGDFTETFDVTVYYNTSFIDTQTVTLASVDFTIITFTWNTTGVAEGNYTISATASIVPGETDTEDNAYINGTVYVRVAIRDVAITSVVPSATEAYAGQLVNITVVAVNEGEVAENFNVTTYYNITTDAIVGMQKVLNLLPGENITLTFVWNTTGVHPCRNYTITAVASIVISETNTSDNTLDSPTKVKVKMLGDVNGDGKIDIRDIAAVARAFGSYPGHPRWNPNLDFDSNDKIDIRDLALVAIRFGECI